MDWKVISKEEQVNQIFSSSSFEKPAVIFKHSTTCPISGMAKLRMQDLQISDKFDFYYLDLLSYRPSSNLIAELSGVQHESPQVLLVKDGSCVYEESHLGISAKELSEQLDKVEA